MVTSNPLMNMILHMLGMIDMLMNMHMHVLTIEKFAD